MRQNRPPKLLGGGPLGGGNIGNRPIHLRYRLLDDEIEQVLLAVEMVVEAALQDADLVGDVAHCGRMIAFGPEHLRGGRNDVVECGHLRSSPAQPAWKVPVPGGSPFLGYKHITRGSAV